MAKELKLTTKYYIAKHFIDNPADTAKAVAVMFRVPVQQVAAIKAHVTIGTYTRSRAFREWLVGKMFSSISENPADSG